MPDDVQDSPEGHSPQHLQADAWSVFERFISIVRASPPEDAEPEPDESPERALFLRTVVAVRTMPDEDAAPPSEFAGLDQHGRNADLPRGPIPPPAPPRSSV
jgi:hypothetical protein